jgi:hypothetical protein
MGTKTSVRAFIEAQHTTRCDCKQHNNEHGYTLLEDAVDRAIGLAVGKLGVGTQIYA